MWPKIKYNNVRKFWPRCHDTIKVRKYLQAYKDKKEFVKNKGTKLIVLNL